MRYSMTRALFPVSIMTALLIVSFTFIVTDDSAVSAGDSTIRRVFAEDITATWCGYCPSASEGLKDLSTERDDFRFITLVDDRVPDAATRIEEFNPTGFPTVMFDGGYDEKVGGVSSGDDYNENIDNCLERDLPEISIELDAYDMGGSEIRVDVTFNNNMNDPYDGILKVMIVEKVSRYLDADGNNYPYSMLGYAINGPIASNPGDEFTFSESWVGADNTDLLGDDFGDIDSSNIIAFASVFNSQNNYKKHPGLNANTYTAHYADAFAESSLSEMGSAPEVTIRSPFDGGEVQGTVDITADVVSENGVDSVEVKVGQNPWKDMALQGTSYSYEWDTTAQRNGLLKISVRAYNDEDLSGIDNIEVDVQNEGSSTPPEISVLTHDPLVPDEGEAIEITLEVFLYDTTISSAEIVVCVDDSCLEPESMTSTDIDRFTLEIGPFDAGQVVSYHAMVQDSEGNLVESRENLFTVQSSGQTADDDDDQIPPDDDDSTPTSDDDESSDVGSGSDQSTIIIVVVVIIVVTIVVAMIIAMSGRRKEKEPEPAYGQIYESRARDQPVQASELELEEVQIK